jgi:hypothetical protein
MPVTRAPSLSSREQFQHVAINLTVTPLPFLSKIASNINTTECQSSASMAFRSTNEGFMETTRYATYYEDNYTKFKNKDDFVEAHDFDVCEDSSEEDRDNPKTKHKRRHIDSYGSIKKPTCKKPFNLEIL